MILFCPKEIKTHEYRVGLVPSAVRELVASGHEVLVETGAGNGADLSDDAYSNAGARVVSSAAEGYRVAELVVKVKEPLPIEYELLRAGQLVFTYFHFAASTELTHAVLKSGATAIAYETLADQAGSLPLLTPMSEVAGRLSIQAGARHLENPAGGRGVLLGGVPGVPAAHVTVLGAGVVGAEAAKMAAGLGARVHLLDNNLNRLRALGDVLPKNVSLLFSDAARIEEELKIADLVVCAVLVRGARAPQLIRRAHLALMKPGSVIVDVAIDQGGCTESSRATTHENPTYVEGGIIHYCVTNMPGAVSRTSTFALGNATVPYVKLIANHGLRGALDAAPHLVSAINMHRGAVTHPAVAEAFGLPLVPFKL